MAAAMHGANAEGKSSIYSRAGFSSSRSYGTTGVVFDMVEDKDGLTEILKSTVIVDSKACEPTTEHNITNNKRSRQTKSNKAADKRTKLAVRRLFFPCV